MYKIKEFAEMIGVTAKTLRNKDKKGLIKPSYISPDSKYRLYTDELAYICDDSKYVLAYLSKTEDINIVNNFKNALNSLGVKYKLFLSQELESNCFGNDAIKELLKDVSNNNTYTVLYNEQNILKEDLKMIKFYINACSPYIKVKKIEDFSLEKSIGLGRI